MAEVQRYNPSTSSWETINNARWRVENGISTKLPAPRATIETTANQTINANDEIRVQGSSNTLFDGFARTGGEYGEGGQLRVECRDDAYKILNEEVTVNLTSATDEEVISTALSNTELGANWTFTYYPTSANSIGDYKVENRKFKVILKDMADRTGLVWRFDADKTLHFGVLGRRGTWQSVETGTDDIRITSWNAGDIATVQNEVTVEGTREDPVSATQTDSTSISNYGKQSVTYSYRWVGSATEASELASELLIPEPLTSGKLTVSPTVGTINQNLANYNITVTDTARDISSEVVVVEKQILQEGHTTLHVGQGAGYAESQVNRDSQSGADAIRQDFSQLGGEVVNSDLGDGSVDTNQLVDTAVINSKLANASVDSGQLVDTSVLESKLADLSVSLNKVQDGAIDTVKITDSAIETPKLSAGAVTASEIAANTITANEIFSDTITANEIASDTISANEIASNTITAGEIVSGTITATEVATGTLTANEISTLDLNTADITIGNDVGADGRIEFDLYQFPDGTELPRLYPSLDGYGELGRSGNWFSSVYSNKLFGTDLDVDTIDAGNGDFSLLAGDATFGMADYDFTISENPLSGKTGPALYPSSSSRAEVGTGDGTTADKAIGSVHTINLYQYSPEPLSPDDPRTDTPADGGRPIDLDELKASTWYDPPEYAAQGKDVASGEYRKNPKREDGTRGVELGHMTNYIFEVTKRLAEERDRLQEQVDDLETRLSKLEAQVGE